MSSMTPDCVRSNGDILTMHLCNLTTDNVLRHGCNVTAPKKAAMTRCVKGKDLRGRLVRRQGRPCTL